MDFSTEDISKINLQKGSVDSEPTVSWLQSGIDVNASWVSTGSGRKGWAAKLTVKKGQDLDLVAVASVGRGPKLMCWYDDVDPFDNGALFSEGDDRKGRGGETIETRWGGLDHNIDRITYILAAFKPGVSFANVSRVVTTVSFSDGSEIGRFRPDIDSSHNAIILGQALKTEGIWSFREANAMATIPRSEYLDPGPEFKRGVLMVARRWAEESA